MCTVSIIVLLLTMEKIYKVFMSPVSPVFHTIEKVRLSLNSKHNFNFGAFSFFFCFVMEKDVKPLKKGISTSEWHAKLNNTTAAYNIGNYFNLCQIKSCRLFYSK